MPGWPEGDGICWAPTVSQVAVRVVGTGCSPGCPGCSRKVARPLAISELATTVQPDGSAAMQGRKAAEGTAWAARIIVWPVPQSGACTPGSEVGPSKPTPKTDRKSVV